MREKQHQQSMRFCLCDGKWNIADDCKPGRKRTLSDSTRKNSQKKDLKQISTNLEKTSFIENE